MRQVKALILFNEQGCSDSEGLTVSLRSVGGLTILQRIIYTIKKSGISDITILSDNEDMSKILSQDNERYPVNIIKHNEFFDTLSNTPLEYHYIIFNPVIIFDSNILTSFLQTLDTADKGFHLFEKEINSSSLLGLFKRMTENRFNLDFAAIKAEERLWFQIRELADIPSFEKKLYNSLIKDSESFMSRYFERKVSIFITKRLVNINITPNMVTIITMLIGILGGIFLGTVNNSMHIFGSILFILSSITDGCDGELARIRFQESRFGSWLDIICDNIVHIFVFCGIAVGLYYKTHDNTFLILAASAAAGVALNTSLVLYKTLWQKKGVVTFNSLKSAEIKREDSYITMISDYLARRDFTYAVLVLAIFGQLEWFLWATVAGLYIFFAAMIFIFYNPYSYTKEAYYK